MNIARPHLEPTPQYSENLYNPRVVLQVLRYSIIPRSLVFSTEQSQVSSSWNKNYTLLFNTNIDSKQNMLGCRSGEVKTDPNSDRESFPSKLSNFPFSLSI